MECGDVVLMSDKDTYQGQWKLDRIVNIIGSSPANIGERKLLFKFCFRFPVNGDTKWLHNRNIG